MFLTDLLLLWGICCALSEHLERLELLPGCRDVK